MTTKVFSTLELAVCTHSLAVTEAVGSLEHQWEKRARAGNLFNIHNFTRVHSSRYIKMKSAPLPSPSNGQSSAGAW